MAHHEKHDSSSSADDRHTPNNHERNDNPPIFRSTLSKSALRRATRPRLIWSLLTSLLFLISVVAIILVELGNNRVGFLNNLYFIFLDLSDIVPVSVPDANLLNSIAQSLGLHDFYTVGLWGYCEGYFGGRGVTDCSSPMAGYYFNPVEIIQSELLAGATIALPSQINSVLTLIKIASQWMFGLYLAGVILAGLLIFLSPLALYTRWASFPLVILGFLAAVCLVVSAGISTAMFVIMQVAVTSVTRLNIRAEIGVGMFVCMWIGALAAVLGWVVLFSGCCCCASRRDVKTGRKMGAGRGRGRWVDDRRGKEDVELEEKEREREVQQSPLQQQRRDEGEDEDENGLLRQPTRP
jgi:hypothetical protein